MSSITSYVTEEYPEALIPNRYSVPEEGAVTTRLLSSLRPSVASFAAANSKYLPAPLTASDIDSPAI